MGGRVATGGGRPQGALDLLLIYPRLEMERSKPCTQFSPAPTQPGTTEEATNNVSCGSSRQVAQGQLQASSNIHLHCKPAQVDPEPTQSVVDFRLHQSPNQLARQTTHQQQGPLEGTRHHLEQLCFGRGKIPHSSPCTVIKVYLYSQSLQGLTHPGMRQQHSRLNYNRRAP